MRRQVVEHIAAIVIRIVTLCVRTIRALRISTSPDRFVLFLPPSVPGNVGDEAIVASFLQDCARQQIRAVVVNYESTHEWQTLRLVESTVLFGDYFRSGNIWSLTAFAWHLRHVDSFVVAGADVLDGFYSEKRSLLRIRLMRVAVQAGVPVEVLGASCNEHPSVQCMKELAAVAKSVRLRARDLRSQTRLESALGCRVELVSDAAFLLHPEAVQENNLELVTWINHQFGQGKQVLGLNLSSSHVTENSLCHGKSLLQSYISVIHRLTLSEQVSVVLIPHDCRGTLSDVSIADDIYSSLPAQVQRFIRVVSFPVSPGAVKTLVSQMSAVVTGRMHLAILCFSVGTPAGAISRQGKFDGLMEHFSLSGNLIPVELAADPDGFAAFCSDILKRRLELKERICSRIGHVVELAQGNSITWTGPLGRYSARPCTVRIASTQKSEYE